MRMGTKREQPGGLGLGRPGLWVPQCGPGQWGLHLSSRMTDHCSPSSRDHQVEEMKQNVEVLGRLEKTTQNSHVIDSMDRKLLTFKE